MTMTPKQVLTHYALSQSTNAGTGVKIGIASMMGTVSKKDLKTLSTNLGLTNTIGWTAVNAVPDRNNSTEEILTDMAVIGSLCPDAKITVYQAGHPANSPSEYVSAYQAIIKQAVTDGCGVLSCSFGAPEKNAYGGKSISKVSVADFNSQVQTAVDGNMVICAATGDTGSDADSGSGIGRETAKNNITFPCGNPNILAWGYYHQWRDRGGGGISAVYPTIPPYQKISGFPTKEITSAWAPQLNKQWKYIKPKNVQVTAGRVVPDVAALATGWDLSTPLKSFTAPEGVDWGNMNGTSLSTPFWASIMAWCVQKNGRGISHIHKKLYNYALNKANASKPVTNDITAGSNNDGNKAIYFIANTGFDACTGLGIPDPNILTDLNSWNKPTDFT